jgi:hypothetical protein
MSDLLERMFGQMPGSEYRGYNVGYGNSDPMQALFPTHKKEPAKKWWAQDVQERQKTLAGEQEKLAGLQRQTGLKEAFKPILNVLQVVGGVLNIPGAAISSAVKQLVDGAPGFNTQEYFQGIFNFKQQASWRDIIGLLAERDPDKNVWDKKWAQIVSGLFLDIALDPTTYLGNWALKLTDLQKKGLKELMENGLELATKAGSQDVFIKLAKRGVSGYGIGLPFVNKMLVPLSKKPFEIAGVLGKIGKGEMVLKEGMGALEKVMQRAPLITKLIKRIPLVKWAEGAFEPWRQAHVKAVMTGLEAENVSRAAKIAIEKEFIKVGKGADTNNVRTLFRIMENPEYYDPKAVQLAVENSNIAGRLIKRVAAGDTLEQAFNKAGKLYKNNQELWEVVRSKFGKELAEKRIVSPMKIVEKFSDTLDDMGMRQLAGLSRENGIPIGDLNSFISKAGVKGEINWEKMWPKFAKNLSENEKKSLIDVVTFVRDLHNRQWDLEYQLGIQKKYVRDYLYHSYGSEKVGKKIELGSSFASAKHRVDADYIKNYDTRIQTLIESGAAKNAKEAEKLIRTPEGGMMVDTILEAAYLRTIGHLKEVHKHYIVEGVKGLGTKFPSTAGAMPFGYARSSVKELGDLIFDTDTARYINQAVDIFSNDKQITQFLGYIDKAQSWWKRLVLMYPGYHFRNFYSNMFIGSTKHGAVSYLNPILHKYSKAITVAYLWPDNKNAWKFFGVSDDLLQTTYEGRKLIDHVNDLKPFGVIKGESRYMVGTDVMKSVAGMEKKIARVMKKGNITAVHNLPAEIMDKIGGFIESEARTASYLLDYKKLGNARLAAYSTNEAFVNYQNLTEFEKQIMRRVVPFWTWMSRNAKNQVALIFTAPGKMAMLPRVADAIEAGAGWKMPEGERPEYFNDLWMWQLPMLLPNGDPLFFNPNFPFQDLNKLDPRHFGRNVMATITPFAKVPLELISGVDTFRRKPIETYEGYRAPVPGILHSIAKVMPEGTQKMLGIEKDERGIMRMNPYTAHAIANLIPFINTSARMFMQEPSPQGSEKYFQALSTILGIKIKPVDKLTRQYETTQQKIKDERAKLKKMGIDVRWNSYRKEWTQVE